MPAKAKPTVPPALPPTRMLRVNLSTGFDMLCAHMEQAGTTTRLYLHNGSNDYVDVKTSQVSSVEETFVAVEPIAADAKDTLGGAAAKSGSRLKASLTPSDVRELVAGAGERHHLDVDLIASVIRAESGGNVRAVSRTGARGLMQLMPGTATENGVADAFDAAQNVEGGTGYLNALLERYHENLALALAAYNAGPGAVDKYHGVPPYAETRAYVARVIHQFNRLKAAELKDQKAQLNASAPPSRRTLVAQSR